MAAKLVNKGFSGWSQFGVLLGMIGVGLVAGTVAAAGTWSVFTGQGLAQMQQDMMNPKFAGAIKAVQLISTLFIFFLPAVAFAFICYRNGWLALGFRKNFNFKIAGFCLLIIIASLPFIDWLSSVNKAIPIPAVTKKYFDDLEKTYEDQVKVIGDVKSVGQYLVSLFMIALLPALFEEVLFRGALQNLLSRWKYNSYLYIFFAAVLAMSAKAIWLKSINPWVFYGVLIVLVLLLLRSRAVTDLLNRVTNHYALPIILTAILFSLVHASWYGFIPRLVLGLVLGLLFYRTNNILYAIIVHFFNNAAVVTIMFIAALQNKPVTNAEEQGFPWWLGIISLGVVFFLFNRLAKQPNISGPDEITDDRSNPFKKAIPENNPEE